VPLTGQKYPSTLKVPVLSVAVEVELWELEEVVETCELDDDDDEVEEGGEVWLKLIELDDRLDELKVVVTAALVL
jgi:hypothetical protein